jgi:TonB-dependent starch-binding outer membrane protein SusC
MRSTLPITGITTRIISLLFILILLFSSIVTANDKAPQVTLQVKNIPLEQVIAVIKKQTHFFFLYEKGILDAKKVSITLKGVSIESAMDQILQDQKLEYKIFDKTVVIKTTVQ